MKLLVLTLCILYFNVIAQVDEEVVPNLVDDEEVLQQQLQPRPIEPIKYKMMTMTTANRRELAPYELCLLCKCCVASNSTCVTMPCCFGIDCQLPNKPFGVCAFVPKTCNCTSCPA